MIPSTMERPISRFLTVWIMVTELSVYGNPEVNMTVITLPDATFRYARISLLLLRLYRIIFSQQTCREL